MENVVNCNIFQQILKKDRKRVGKDRNKNKNKNAQDKLMNEEKKTNFWEHPLVVAMITLAISTLVTYIGQTITTRNSDIREDVTAINNRIDGLSTEMDEMEDSMNEKIDEFKEVVNEQFNEINREIGVLEGKVDIALVIEPNDALEDSLTAVYSSDQAVFNASQKRKRVIDNTNKVIATNISGEIEYTAKDLENEIIILTYINTDGEEVFFKGQYDENGYWDGNCVINRYRDNVLTMIMDAEYNSGELISYKQVFSYTSRDENKNPIEVWAVSERKVDGTANSGETWIYFKEEEYEKEFDINTVKLNDIKSRDMFCMDMNLEIAGFYSGYTSNGSFNDDTGEAYMVKYTKGGYVSLLYFGRFVNGEPEDLTGEAWFIGLGNWGYDYFYYKGNMRNGSRVDTPSDWAPLTKEEIRELIDDRSIKSDLRWLWDDKVITI